MGLTLSGIAQSYSSPLWDSPPELDSRIAVLAARSEAMVSPLEESAKRAVDLELALCQMTQAFRDADFRDPGRLNMAFMQRTSRQPVEGMRRQRLLPCFALVPYLVGKHRPCHTPTCNLDDGYTSPRWYRELIGAETLRAMKRDISLLERLLAGVPEFTYQFDGPIPDEIREMARIADSTGFEVYLVCQAEGLWNGEYAPSDPLLVAEKHGSWFLLGLFDPTPLEEWAASEMLTPLHFAPRRK